MRPRERISLADRAGIGLLCKTQGTLTGRAGHGPVIHSGLFTANNDLWRPEVTRMNSRRVEPMAVRGVATSLTQLV